jgi:hypothetical protein
MSFFSSLRNGTSECSSRGRALHRPPAARCRPRLEALEDRRLPSQVGLTVTSLADSGPGSLRAAIQAADAGSRTAQFTIGFTVTGTIDLQSPLPDLNNRIAVQGPGASSLTVERLAGATFSTAIVTVDAGQTASLSGLTVANGNAGGIKNNGTLTVASSAALNNTGATSPVFNNSTTFGGGVYNFGTLTLIRSTVSGDSATFGGGIYNAGTLTISGSTVSGNSALHGGGVFNDGTLTISGSTVSGNSAAGRGGGIDNDAGTSTVVSSTFSGNSAGVGGAIFNSSFDGTLDVRGSTLSGNTTTTDGGAIFNDGTATVEDCTLSGNTASEAGGGIFNGVDAHGVPGTLALKGSTVLDNLALARWGADIYNLGVLSLGHSIVGVIGP